MSAALFEPSAPLGGSLETAADKSISHRAALLAAMADGTSRIEHFLLAEDTRSTLAAVASLGARVEVVDDLVTVEGIGLHGPREVDGVIDVGNCGTLMRLLPGWLAGQAGRRWTIDGDASIRRRPIDRVAEPLAVLGASIEADRGRPPFVVEGAALKGGRVETAIASAQVKGAVLLAGLLADSPVEAIEPVASRDHSERMLAEQGARLGVRDAKEGHGVAIEPIGSLRAVDRVVPGDPSSAAFLGTAAILVPGSEVMVRNVCLNPGRIGYFRILERMGASIEGLPEDEPEPLGPEPVGDLTFRHSELRATDVGADEVPATIDELPLLALAACFAEGRTTVSGASELRHKETDRIATVVEGLSAIGGDAEALEDGFSVEGTGRVAGGRLESHGDHRLAMIGAVAGLASEAGVEVGGFEAVGISYPGFAADIASLA